MTYIVKSNRRAAGTHAIVIGVGVYNHLRGAPRGRKGKLFPLHENMEQLTSPPESARVFAKWLLEEYNNPRKPLASLQLLISDSKTNKFPLPDNTQIQIKKATKKDVTKAIENWDSHGNRNKGNLLMFYFCGHALARGLFLTLLLEDYGKNPRSPLKNTIDFNGLYGGMEQCKAREQCYFVDACRNTSIALIQYNDRGDPIFPERNLFSGYGTRRGPIYFSTVAGDTAYGRPEAPSLFTDALLRSLRGAGSDNIEGPWRVDDDLIGRGINHVVPRLVTEEEGIEQLCDQNHTTGFPIHFLKDKPIVPVSIGCAPKNANKVADLSYKSKATKCRKTRRKKKLSEWNVDLKEGNYDFLAKFPTGKYRDKTESQYIRPPFRPVTIKVR